jgi:acyl-CoA synthetase (AMP-forming)/AMP-acid ligase II
VQTDDLHPTTAENIARARTVNEVPVSESLVPYHNIGQLLEDQVDRHEQKPFLIYYGEDGFRKELSYREFFDETCKTANYLLSLGIVQGDRIGVASHNHPDMVIQYFAAFLLGAVVVPVNMAEDDRRIAYVLRDSGAKLVFVRDQYVNRILELREELPELRTIVQAGKPQWSDLPHFQTELQRQPVRFRPKKSPALHDVALIVYTSGITGHPKGVVLEQYNLLVDAMAIGEWHRISDDQRMMCVLPLYHVNGIVVTLMTPLYTGGSVVICERFHSDKFFERISIERVTVVSVVPTLLQFLLHTKLPMGGYKLAPFRHVICGAGPLTVELAQKYEQMFSRPIIHGYGLSETTCYSCFVPIDLTPTEHKHWMTAYGFPSIGVPLSVNEMTIHDDAGNEMPEGERGEIVIRGHNVMRRYFGEPEANSTTFAHGWFRSGDEGFYHLDGQGRRFFFITGRIKELIIRGGLNISPFEIDEVLNSAPGVLSAIAVGFENDWYGEEVGALVKLRPGFETTEAQVLAHCAKHLPFVKTPKVVIFSDEIPVTSTGKFQRGKCRELFERWKGEQFSMSPQKSPPAA